MIEDRQIGRTRSPFVAAAFLASVAIACLSCGNLRNDLFGFTDARNRPQLGFNPDPASGPFTRPTRVTIWTSARFSDWPIRYTIDPAATLEQPELWKTYDPGKGIILGSSVSLRAVAFQPAAEGLSDIAQADYAFDLPNVQVYVRPDAPEGGDGTGPETPFNTLQAGIDLAASLYVSGGPLVVVCAYQGEYRENPVMKAGVLVRGSYHDDWREPDFEGLANQDLHPPSLLAGGAGTEGAVSPVESAIPLHTLRFPAGLAAPSGIEGFHVRAPNGGTNSAAILVESRQVSVLRCRVEGGNAGSVTAGIWSKGGGTIAERCFVQGRSIPFPGDSAGILSFDSIMDVRGSTVETGSGIWDIAYAQKVAGIYAYSSTGLTDLRVSGCEVFAEGGEGVRESTGIYASGGYADIADSVVNRATTSAIHATYSCETAGIKLENAGGRVVNNQVLAIGCSSTADASYYCKSRGIFVGGAPEAATIAIERNSITSGTSEDDSYGMVIDGAGPVMISRNDILAGSGKESNGLRIWLYPESPTSRIIERNRIWGGMGNASAIQRVGLFVISMSLNAPVVVRNNIIHGGLGSGTGSLCRGANINAISGPEYLYLLSNTIWSGGYGASGDNEFGLYMDTSGPSNVDIIGNIIDSHKLPIYFPDVSAVRFFWHNVVYSDNAATYGVIYTNGTYEYSYGILDSGPPWSSGDVYDNTITEIYPRVYNAGSTYPDGPDAFRTFDFGFDTDSSTTSIINTYGFDGTRVIPAGVSNGLDFNGNSRTLPRWTPGAIERE